jgi:lysozyme
VSYVNPDFAADWTGATAAGLRVGAYHFFSLCDSGVAQASHFLKVEPPDATLPAAVDLELAGNCHARPPQRWVRAQVRTYLATVHRLTGHTVIVYLGGDFAGRYPSAVPPGQPLWLRSLLFRPAGRWAIWQVDGNAQVAGITGNVDLDVMRPPSHAA